MGKAQKVKGSRVERELAHLINGSRIPLSGAAKHLGAAYPFMEAARAARG